MKGVALGVNNNNSESQMDVAWVAHSDSNRVGTIDDGINYVDEDAYIMTVRNQMHSCLDPVQVSTTLCQSLVLYRNDNYGD